MCDTLNNTDADPDIIARPNGFLSLVCIYKLADCDVTCDVVVPAAADAETENDLQHHQRRDSHAVCSRPARRTPSPAVGHVMTPPHQQQQQQPYLLFPRRDVQHPQVESISFHRACLSATLRICR